MTTKESILDQHVKYAWECDQASPVIPYSEAWKAMDEWAKQQVIAFNECRIANRWQLDIHGRWYQAHSYPTLTPGEMYNEKLLKVLTNYTHNSLNNKLRNNETKAWR